MLAIRFSYTENSNMMYLAIYLSLCCICISLLLPVKNVKPLISTEKNDTLVKHRGQVFLSLTYMCL